MGVEQPSCVQVPAVPSCHSYGSSTMGDIVGSLLCVTQYARYVTYNTSFNAYPTLLGKSLFPHSAVEKIEVQMFLCPKSHL